MPQVSRTQRLIVVLALNLGLVAALVIVGIMAHSLACWPKAATISWTPPGWPWRC